MSVHGPSVTIYHMYGLVLIVLSLVLTILVIVNSYKFSRHSKNRFISTRKPNLILLYCICGTIPSLLIIVPCKILITVYDSIYYEDVSFIGWLLTFLEEFCISSMSIVIAMRCWLLFYDHSYEISVVDKTWRGIINPNDTDFWLKYRKTWGDFGFIICFGIVMSTIVLMLFSITSIYALKYNNLVILHGVSLFFVAIPCYLFIGTLIIYGKRSKIFIMNNDKFQIIREMQYLSLSTLLMIIIYIMVLIDISQLILVIETGQIIFCFITSWIQNKWVIQQLRKHDIFMLETPILKNKNNGNNINNDTKRIQLTMSDVLRNKYGFGMFMRHCQSELNVEGLLFVIEVAQYKAKLLDNDPNILSVERSRNLTLELSETEPHSRSSEPSSDVDSNGKNHEVLPGLSTIRTSSDGGSVSKKTLKKKEFEKFEGNILARNWMPISKEILPEKCKAHKTRTTLTTIHVEAVLHDEFTADFGRKEEEEEKCDNNQQEQVPEMVVTIEWIHEYARYLFMKYIDVDSEFSINVSYGPRQKLLLFFSKTMEKGFESILGKKGIMPLLNQEICDFNDEKYALIIKIWLYHLFDSSLAEIWKLLSTDTFVRFMHTPQYQYLLNKYNKHQLQVDK